MSHPLGVFLGAKSGEQFLTDFDELSGAIVVRGFLESREFYGARVRSQDGGSARALKSVPVCHELHRLPWPPQLWESVSM